MAKSPLDNLVAIGKLKAETDALIETFTAVRDFRLGSRGRACRE